MKNKIETQPPRPMSEAEFRRKCEAYEYECLEGYAYCEAERMLLESAKAVRGLLVGDMGFNDRDLIASYYAIVAAHVAKGVR